MSIPNAKATLVLVLYLLISGLAYGVYTGLGIGQSPYFINASVFAWCYIVWFWIRSDCRRLGINTPIDLGFFTLMGWPVAYTYHFIKTRGWTRGLLLVSAMFGVLWYGYAILVAVTVSVVAALLRPGA